MVFKRLWLPRKGGSGTPVIPDTVGNLFDPGDQLPIGKAVDEGFVKAFGWNQIIDNINNQGSLKEIEDIFPRPFESYPLMEVGTTGVTTDVMGQQILELRTILDTWWGLWDWTVSDLKTLDRKAIEELRYRASCGQGFHLSSTGSNQEFEVSLGEVDNYNGLGDLLFTTDAFNTDVPTRLLAIDRVLALMPEEAGRFWVMFPVKLTNDSASVNVSFPGYQVLWGPITLDGKCKNVNGYGVVVPPKGQRGLGPLGNKEVLYYSDLMVVSQKSDPELFEPPTVQMVYGNSIAGMAGYGYGFPFKVSKYGQYAGGNVGESSLWGKIGGNSLTSSAYWDAWSNTGSTAFTLTASEVRMTGAKKWIEYSEVKDVAIVT